MSNHDLVSDEELWHCLVIVKLNQTLGQWDELSWLLPLNIELPQAILKEVKVDFVLDAHPVGPPQLCSFHEEVSEVGELHHKVLEVPSFNRIELVEAFELSHINIAAVSLHAFLDILMLDNSSLVDKWTPSLEQDLVLSKERPLG